MPELQLLVLFAFGVKVNAAHAARTLIEAYVVETFEAGSGDCFDAMIGYEKVFFPPHEEVLSLLIVLECEVG